jgi:putative redox protein
MASVHVETAGGPFAQTVTVRHHSFISDEPPASGGEDRGPSPTELLLGALGACVAMTVKMYAARKGWAIGEIEVELSGKDEGAVYVVERRLSFSAPVSDDQRQRLTEVAGRCPVSRRITGQVEIRPVS